MRVANVARARARSGASLKPSPISYIADHRKSNARADTGTDPVAHDFCQTDRGSNPGAVSGAIDLATAKPNPNRLADIDAIALSHGFAKRSANISAVAKSDDGHTDGGTDAG